MKYCTKIILIIVLLVFGGMKESGFASQCFIAMLFQPCLLTGDRAELQDSPSPRLNHLHFPVMDTNNRKCKEKIDSTQANTPPAPHPKPMSTPSIFVGSNGQIYIVNAVDSVKVE